MERQNAYYNNSFLSSVYILRQKADRLTGRAEKGRWKEGILLYITKNFFPPSVQVSLCHVNTFWS